MPEIDGRGEQSQPNRGPNGLPDTGERTKLIDPRSRTAGRLSWRLRRYV